MKQNHRIAVAVRWSQTPSAEHNPVFRRHRNICQFSMFPCRNRSRARLIRWPKNATPRMQRPLARHNANQPAENQPDRNNLQTKPKKDACMSHGRKYGLRGLTVPSPRSQGNRMHPFC
jgi:hypothetical protein